MEKVALRKVVTFEGKEYSSLELDFDRLTGKALRKIERRLTEEGVLTLNAAVSLGFCAYAAAVAADVPAELMDELGAPDYMEVTTLAQVFLMGTSAADLRSQATE